MRLSKLNILLVEDDQSYAWFIRRALRGLSEKHSITHVERVSSALRQLAGGDFDIILTDLTLPDAVKLESVESLRAFSADLPLVVLTSFRSMDMAAAALRAGAQEFIVKDLMTPELLEGALLHAIERHRIVVENTQMVADLRDQRRLLEQRNTRMQELVETAHRFVDNVSHEFRTPLTVIREYASLMRDGLMGEISPDQADLLDVIGYRVDDLNRMVDDMLDSSKLEAGIMSMHRRPADVVQIVERALTGLQLKARARNVELQLTPPGPLPQIFCDPEKVNRIVTNLVSNAIKFCGEDTGRVVVSLEHRPDESDVEVSVADNGPGIEPEDLSRMFERFRQLGTSTASTTKGFGLGLNIVRELVDHNYGEIEVESEPGQGTTFRFTLPVDYWPGIIRRHAERHARNDPAARISVVRATTCMSLTEAGARDLDSFWRYTECPTDLCRQTGPNEWLLLLTCGAKQLDEAIARLESERASISRSRPTPLPDLQFTKLGSFSALSEIDLLLQAASGPQVTRKRTERPSRDAVRLT